MNFVCDACELLEIQNVYRPTEGVGAILVIGTNAAAAAAIARRTYPEKVLCFLWKPMLPELPKNLEDEKNCKCDFDTYMRLMTVNSNYLLVEEDLWEYLAKNPIKFCYSNHPGISFSKLKAVTKLVHNATICGKHWEKEDCKKISANIWGFVSKIERKIWPISYSIAPSLIVKEIPKKRRDFALYVPGMSYSFSTQEAYYQNYQESYYGWTCKKGGFDCLRHYEILANGCMPYFDGLEKCPPTKLTHLPKTIILEAMKLPGVDPVAKKIDFAVFSMSKYNELLTKAMEHMRAHLTGPQMAKYVLSNLVIEKEIKRVLFISNLQAPDYMRCSLLIGFRTLLGEGCIDFPKIEHLYDDYPKEKTANLYGRGFTYTRHLDSQLVIDRSYIREKITARFFDAIVFGSVHGGKRDLFEICCKYYKPREIALICGSDEHSCSEIEEFEGGRLFMREL